MTREERMERLLEEILAELKTIEGYIVEGVGSILEKIWMELEEANEFNRRLVKILELVLVKEMEENSSESNTLG